MMDKMLAETKTTAELGEVLKELFVADVQEASIKHQSNRSNSTTPSASSARTSSQGLKPSSLVRLWLLSFMNLLRSGRNSMQSYGPRQGPLIGERCVG